MSTSIVYDVVINIHLVQYQQLTYKKIHITIDVHYSTTLCQMTLKRLNSIDKFTFQVKSFLLHNCFYTIRDCTEHQNESNINFNH